MSFPFEKGQGREAIWQGGEDTVLHQADLSLNPESTPGWLQDSGHANISVHSWKDGDKSHFAGSWTKCTGSAGRPPRTWESSVTGCTVPVSGPKSLGSDMQQKSSFPACSMEFPISTAQEQPSAHHLKCTHPLTSENSFTMHF